MGGFDYHDASSVAEAIERLSTLDDAHLIAGGTALALLLKQGLVAPAHLVGIRHADELCGITRTADGGLEIRSLTTHSEAEHSPLVRSYCAALGDTFGAVATVRIRNQGTVGGNIVHADPAQDPPPMLIALDGVAVLRGPAGERSVPLDGFFVDYYETAIRHGEVLVSTRLPPLAPTARVGYAKYLPISKDDYATVSVAARLELDPDGRCADVRVVLGAVGSTPIRATAVEDAIRGAVPTPRRVHAAAALVEDAIDPIDDARGTAAYKRAMARVWVERTILDLRGRRA